MFRRALVLLFSVALCSWPTVAQPASDNLPRQEIAVPNFEASGWILDLGGGCRGTIGPELVAPPCFQPLDALTYYLQLKQQLDLILSLSPNQTAGRNRRVWILHCSL